MFSYILRRESLIKTGYCNIKNVVHEILIIAVF